MKCHYMFNEAPGVRYSVQRDKRDLWKIVDSEAQDLTPVDLDDVGLTKEVALERCDYMNFFVANQAASIAPCEADNSPPFIDDWDRPDDGPEDTHDTWAEQADEVTPTRA